MRVHHINAATLCPPSALLVNGHGGLFERARLVCHVLLLETNEGLVLVDTGIGLQDIAEPSRLGLSFLRLAAPRLDPNETAVNQVRARGFSLSDVRHILLTHLDRDHAGGLGDFPHAHVHVHLREYQAAVTHQIPVKPGRYISAQWKHSPNWKFYGDGGENWFGFAGVRAFGDANPDILIIPLHGHTPGHCGLAVRQGEKWLLHAGDSFYSHGQIDAPPSRMPVALGLFQRWADADRGQRVANQERLRALKARTGREVAIICSHDPTDFDRDAQR